MTDHLFPVPKLAPNQHWGLMHSTHAQFDEIDCCPVCWKSRTMPASVSHLNEKHARIIASL
ncbi:hypothetical protein [Tritonibacter mobilis]|uniref:hypothetical protein n=1 Tax=Tritonibacter mobilis TaxID=379347 RepID=UPI000A7F7ED6|nr:hypothetical protein [Tritonibacter mobilis]